MRPSLASCSHALVSNIKEWQVALGLAHIRNLGPLLFGGVHPRWVVGAACTVGGGWAGANAAGQLLPGPLCAAAAYDGRSLPHPQLPSSSGYAKQLTS